MIKYGIDKYYHQLFFGKLELKSKKYMSDKLKNEKQLLDQQEFEIELAAISLAEIGKAMFLNDISN